MKGFKDSSWRREIGINSSISAALVCTNMPLQMLTIPCLCLLPSWRILQKKLLLTLRHYQNVSINHVFLTFAKILDGDLLSGRYANRQSVSLRIKSQCQFPIAEIYLEKLQLTFYNTHVGRYAANLKIIPYNEHTYIHTYLHTYTHTHIRTYIHTYKYIYTYIRRYIHI